MNTVWIFKVAPGISTGRLTAEERNRKPLTYEDAQAIREQCPAVREVSVSVMQRIYDMHRPPVITARYQDKEVSGLNYSGSDIYYPDVYNAKTYIGRYFTDAEDTHREDVAVIGYDLGKTFFPDGNALDKIIYVEGFPYRVIGVFEHRKGELFQDPPVEKQVLVPYHTYRKHHPADDEHFIGAEAYPGKMAEAKDEISAVLRRTRHVPYSAPENFGTVFRRRNRQPVQADHRFRGAAHRGGQLDRVAGGRSGRDEHHADVRYATNPGDRRAQSDWRAPPRRDLAIFD